ncbi:HXXEE domain-containing protein [Sporolactobacillus laevolacticus]|uniref:HXXEE domain-containing protein n=1 Tax=Sporolactobacillus laevolacticus TaxID=33018 RepID=UPI0025B596A0|nr:HXXEE domain-containing protein [Sporolactobacillus laevolacticus]MDN3954529.1 HXXEE domain-containing protein [Sporolactobacillus laevolacticus]
MGNWLDSQTLIWFFPIVFVFHDFEEIIMIERWNEKNKQKVYQRLPRQWADRMIRQFSMSTAQFSVAVLVVFLFVSSFTYMASQYVRQGPGANIYCFTTATLLLFIHSFTHIGQSVFFRSITPGAVTSLIIVLPYSLVLLYSLLESHVLTWSMIFFSLPFMVLALPVVLLAHFIGKKVV